MHFKVLFFILLLVALRLEAGTLPTCQGPISGQELEAELFLHEIARETLHFSLNQYSNELLTSAEVRQLISSEACKTPAKRKFVRGFLSSLIKSELGDPGACRKIKGLSVSEIIQKIIDRTTAFVCGDSGTEKLPVLCKSETPKVTALAMYDARLYSVADQIRAIDEILQKDFKAQKMLLYGVVCNESPRCYKYGKQVSFEDSNKFKNWLEKIGGLTRQRSFLLSTYPILGLSKSDHGSSWESAFEAPFAYGGLALAASNGSKVSFEALRENFSISRRRLYQHMDYDSLALGKRASRALIASTAMSFICADDAEDLALEILRTNSPIVTHAWNRFQFNNPKSDAAFCVAKQRVEDSLAQKEMQAAAIYLGAAAVGIAATPFTGSASLALVAASSGLGYGVTTYTTRLTTMEADQARALYQMCAVGFDEMFRHETAEVKQKIEALTSYALDTAGIFLEGMKLKTFAFKKTPKVLQSIKGNIVKEEAFDKFLRDVEAKGIVVNDEFIADLDLIHTTGKFQEFGLDVAKGREMARFLKKYPQISRYELLYLADKNIGVLGIRSRIKEFFGPKPKHVFVPKKKINVVLKDVNIDEMYEHVEGLPLLKGRIPAEDVLQRSLEIPNRNDRAGFIRHVSNLRKHRPHPPGLRQAEWWWFEYFKNGRNVKLAGNAVIPMKDLDSIEKTYLKFAYELDLCNPASPCFKDKKLAEEMFRRRDALIEKLEALQARDSVTYNELFAIDKEYLILDDETLSPQFVSRGLDNDFLGRGYSSEESVKVIVNRPMDAYEVATPYSGIVQSDLQRGLVRFDNQTANAKFYRHHDHGVHARIMQSKMPKKFDELVVGFEEWNKDWVTVNELLKGRDDLKEFFVDSMFKSYHEEFGDTLITYDYIKRVIRSKSYLEDTKEKLKNELLEILDQYR